jgi:hypothetical protein
MGWILKDNRKDEQYVYYETARPKGQHFLTCNEIQNYSNTELMI